MRPHAAHEKMQEFDRAPFGITGLETAFGLCLETLHRMRGLPLSRLLALFTQAGRHGSSASTGREREPCGSAPPRISRSSIPMSAGTTAPQDSLSRSKNSPFDGHSMQGRVKYTIVSGKIVFEHRGPR